MSSISLRPAKSIKGTISIPGDKSISQRAIIISSIAKGKTIISNLLIGDDCLYLIQAFKSMGADIKIISKNKDEAKISLKGKGLHGLTRPKKSLYLGNSGTAARLLSGILAAQNFETQIKGDASLSSRPMRRIIQPLREMDGLICAKKKGNNDFLPLIIRPQLLLKSIQYKLPIPSAQVKSAILFAGLYAHGCTTVYEPIQSRDHTERMLKAFGADVKIDKSRKSISISGGKALNSPGRIFIPSDISSAAYFIIAGLILKGSKLKIKSVGINPTRDGMISVLKRMGANIRLEKKISLDNIFEPISDIIVSSSDLRGSVVNAKEIPQLIDEIPLIMVAACFAKGKTVVNGVQELRVKEADRIKSMAVNLRKMGANIKVIKHGKREDLIITGVKALYGNKLESFGDHRTAMSMAIAALAAKGSSIIKHAECINKSFPTFFTRLKSIIKH